VGQELGEIHRLALLRDSAPGPSAARGHAQECYQRADSHGWNIFRVLELGGTQPQPLFRAELA